MNASGTRKFLDDIILLIFTQTYRTHLFIRTHMFRLARRMLRHISERTKLGQIILGSARRIPPRNDRREREEENDEMQQNVPKEQGGFDGDPHGDEHDAAEMLVFIRDVGKQDEGGDDGGGSCKRGYADEGEERFAQRHIAVGWQ